jgi:hypothetical protein
MTWVTPPLGGHQRPAERLQFCTPSDDEGIEFRKVLQGNVERLAVRSPCPGKILQALEDRTVTSEGAVRIILVYLVERSAEGHSA